MLHKQNKTRLYPGTGTPIHDNYISPVVKVSNRLELVEIVRELLERKPGLSTPEIIRRIDQRVALSANAMNRARRYLRYCLEADPRFMSIPSYRNKIGGQFWYLRKA